MKTLLKSFLAFSLLFTNFLFAQTITKSTFKVKGECGMCKERIETTAKKSGATYANWSAEKQELAVEYDAAKVTSEEILKQIAAVGHDNEKFSAPNEVYENLPGCCHYERQPSILTLKTEENSNPQKPDNQFFVRGNCVSCKIRIEKAAKTAGADAADWNAETQTVTLNFNPTKTSADAILKKIADVGHDNEKYTASDSVYKNLPDCCLYDRTLPLGVKSDLVHMDESPAPKKDFTQHADHVDKSIEEVKLIKMAEATALNKKETGLTFNISSKELLKAACCNLSESFETNATVDVSFSNAVTGTKQLKMLGLDQKYTSLTKELLPSIRGLASPYGMNLIPGRWIGGIQLTKGGSTVTNGYESITGQINTELLKMQDKPETAINFFGDINGRFESNITSISNISDKWNQSVLLHGNATLAKMDTNDDGFLDQPTGNQINAAYLLDYNDLENSGLGSHFGISFVKDERFGGQKDFDKNVHRSQQSPYGIGIDIAKFDVWNKTGYIFKGKPYQSIGLMNQFTYHQQDSFFGQRNYLGNQKTFYSNLIFESIFGNTNHKYKTGASFLYDDFDENYLTQNFKRTETVPGLFFEYTLTGLKYTLVAGARTDFHNLAGTQFTPRLNFKYDISPKTILRLSAGKGFRTANIFAENQQYFASNRQIEILGNGGNIYDLKPEIAWNYGASLQQEFKLFNRKATLVADFFRTDFQDQVLADLDISPNKIVFYNLEGNSYANSFQTQLDFVPAKNLELRLAYKYYDVQADYSGGKREIPFMAKNRGFFNASYATDKNDKGAFWNFDTTLQLVGKQKLPNLNANPAEFRLPEYSDSFATLNAQISRNFNKNIRVYLGGENLTSYTQDQPIIDSKNPFGNYFDGGMVYAPIMPANVYLGLDVSF
ncbi:TonB-dependent receptor [Chryseobacterium sp. HSC-36S06]|uniref:TonB-dependent receptor domain-containing protein n=1 Tax=Chryseobacterium sp. HSC-36S06 TaxID=2910970 RepID=UPI00209E0E96|nr:TonB-dependent receptor [Chryseobacterium sp. HSC-36S06]MCP2037355.1 outer membrane receptor protein involved in Fe transport/copper chaperone CopZ [Chryseobacterium sp. HSC-36S06]